MWYELDNNKSNNNNRDVNEARESEAEAWNLEAEAWDLEAEAEAWGLNLKPRGRDFSILASRPRPGLRAKYSDFQPQTSKPKIIVQCASIQLYWWYYYRIVYVFDKCSL
mgnify:CR=1 FL=1